MKYSFIALSMLGLSSLSYGAAANDTDTSILSSQQNTPLAASLIEDFNVDDLEDIEFEAELVDDNANRWKEFFARHISGAIGSFNSFDNNDSQTHIHFLKFRYDGDFENIDLAIEGIIPSIDIQLSHVRKEGETNSTGDLPETIHFGYKDNDFILREAYLTATPTEWAKISAGRSIVTWGQLPNLSPINLVFPLNYTPTDITSSKVAFTLPQDNISLSLFVNKNIVITGYYFPTLNFHPLLEKGKFDANIDKYLVPILKVKNANGINAPSNTNTENSTGSSGGAQQPASAPSPIIEEFEWIETDVGLLLPSKSEARQYGIRAMFYYGEHTLGLSYYNGWDVNRITKFNRLTNLHSLTEPRGYEYVSEAIGVARQKALAIEYSTYFNDWNIIVEAMVGKGQESLIYFPDAESTAQRQEYFDWIVDNNNRELFIETTDVILGVGAHREFAKWKLSFGLFNTWTLYGDHEKQGVSLQDQAFPGKKGENTETIYPVFSLERSLCANKECSAGFAGGVLGYGYGLSLFYNQSFRESFNIGLSVRQITYFVNEILVPREYKEDYEPEASSSTSIGINFSYAF